jgi:hypothetical protein
VVLLKQRFLDEFRQRGNITAAVRAVGIARVTPYRWCEADKKFAEAFADSAEEAIELMEWEARRRAMGEVQTPVYHNGEVVGHIPRYSDSLLMFLLRAHRPEKYRERYEHRVGDADGRPLFPLEAARAAMEAARSSR